MQSTAATVDAYLETVPADRIDAIRRIRALCLELLPGYDEYMEYGMPAYSRDGVGGVAFNNQKRYISLYVAEAIVDAHRHELRDAGKCCIRYSNPAKIDYSIIEALLRETAASNEPVCP